MKGKLPGIMVKQKIMKITEENSRRKIMKEIEEVTKREN